MSNGMAEGRHLWTHSETIALIDAWEQRYEQLKSQRRTAHVHGEIQQALSSNNIDKTIRQIVVKIDNLTQKYRKTKASGKSNPTWSYFKRLDGFMDRHSRSTRRTEKDLEEQPCCDIKIDETATVSGAAGQNAFSGLSFTNPFAQEWRSPSETELALKMSNRTAYEEELAVYRMELLSVISSLVEIQRHSFAVQEKIITLVTRMANNSCEPHATLKSENE